MDTYHDAVPCIHQLMGVGVAVVVAVVVGMMLMGCFAHREHGFVVPGPFENMSMSNNNNNNNNSNSNSMNNKKKASQQPFWRHCGAAGLLRGRVSAMGLWLNPKPFFGVMGL
eukprot:352688-Chlamydomonas_euryale.AAC.2